MNKQTDQPQVYYCPDHIRWAYETTHILLVDGVAGQAYKLTGEEMAIWDWLMLGYRFPRLVQHIALLSNLTPAAAEQRLRQQLQIWCDHGWLHNGVTHG